MFPRYLRYVLTSATFKNKSIVFPLSEVEPGSFRCCLQLYLCRIFVVAETERRQLSYNSPKTITYTFQSKSYCSNNMTDARLLSVSFTSKPISLKPRHHSTPTEVWCVNLICSSQTDCLISSETLEIRWHNSLWTGWWRSEQYLVWYVEYGERTSRLCQTPHWVVLLYLIWAVAGIRFALCFLIS